MLSILFWNLAKNPATLPHLACLARTHLLDVLLLAEAPEDLSSLKKSLNSLQMGSFREAIIATTKVVAWTRLAAKAFSHCFTNLSSDLSIWSIQQQNQKPVEILLAATHLPAKVGGNVEADQAAVAREIAADIAKIEDQRGHRQTVLAGDFNMNPFEPGMTMVDCFHGLMTRELANRSDRKYRKQAYRRFYNPMWGLFGDRTPGPAGSHYWRASVLHNTHWAIYDQVLVRPGLLDRLCDLSIVCHDGTHSLLAKDQAPDKRLLSDHLPIFFRLDV